MKQLILEKEWIELLENRSAELLAKVLSALCAYVLRGEEPTGLDPVEQLAYDFIKTEMLRNEQRYDFDAACEAAIKKKRAAERRAEKAKAKAEAEAKQKSENTDPEPVTRSNPTTAEHPGTEITVHSNNSQRSVHESLKRPGAS